MKAEMASVFAFVMLVVVGIVKCNASLMYFSVRGSGSVGPVIYYPHPLFIASCNFNSPLFYLLAIASSFLPNWPSLHMGNGYMSLHDQSTCQSSYRHACYSQSEMVAPSVFLVIHLPTNQ